MDIARLLSSYKIRYASAGKSIRQGWLGLDCPFCCAKKGELYLGINATTGACSCWRCGPKRLADILVALGGIPPAEAWSALEPLRGRSRIPANRPLGRLALPPALGELGPQHLAYLASRGLDGAALGRIWGLKGITISARLSWRIFIPIRVWDETVSWTTRAIGNGRTRYITARPDEERLPARSVLYGSELARHAVVVVEGPVDAWAIGPGAVSTLGIGYTQAQVAALAAYPIRVICFDTEDKAQERARRLATDLSAFPGQTHNVVLQSGKDAAEADSEEIKELRARFLS